MSILYIVDINSASIRTVIWTVKREIKAFLKMYHEVKPLTNYLHKSSEFLIIWSKCYLN